MSQIAQIEEELLRAYRAARGSGIWDTVTFVTPSRLASLQWRRRLARRAGGVFNARFVDLPDLVAELMARSGAPIRRVSPAGALAAAWSSLVEGCERFRSLAAHPMIPGQVVRAFDVFESLDDEQQARVSPDFAALANSLRQRLGEELTATGAMKAALQRLPPVADYSRFILLAAESGNDLTTKLLAKAFAGTATVNLDGVTPSEERSNEVRTAEVHDEQDEVALAITLIQDWAVREGIPPSEVAVIIPAADPYAKLLSLACPGAKMQWNGTSARSIGESSAGRRLGAASLEFSTWEEARAAWSHAVGEDAQHIRDELDSWSGIEAFAPRPDPSLLEALRRRILKMPLPRTDSFGDGVFVGTPTQTLGLVFRRIIVLGCTSSRYPQPAGVIPFLPPGIGVVSAETQRRAFRRLVGRGETTILLHARSDRRNEREAFPTPWLTDFEVSERSVVHSSLELLQRRGPRTEPQRRIASSISSGVVDRRGRPLRDSWDGDVVAEAAAGKNLLPEVPVSPSQLETFFECPRKWFFRYVEKLAEPEETPPFGLSPLDMGAIVHSVLQSLFTRRRAELIDPQYSWSDEDHEFVWDELKRLAALANARPDVKPASAELKRMGTQLSRMLERDSNYRRDLEARPIRTEYLLRGRIAELEVAGKADRLDRVGDAGLKVIDYKTGRGAPAKKGDPTRGGKTLQGLIYAELARQSARTLGLERVDRVVGEYWYLGRRIQEMEEVHPLDENSHAQLEEFVCLAGEMMSAGLVPMRPTRSGERLCEYCAYRSICPAEREAIVARQGRSSERHYVRFLRVTGQEAVAE